MTEEERTEVINQFLEKLRTLLREQVDAGLSINDICELAEYTLEHSWE